MFKVLLDQYEALTHAKLEPLCADLNARVYPKVRLADVLPIEQSGISFPDYRFALQSHFDFLVTDSEHKPLFAVEYDGASHLSAVQIGRDAVKNGLCNRFGFPILRVNSRYLDAHYRGIDLLTWFVEVWFAARAFDEAREAGHIPWDEPFDALSVFRIPGREGTFPLWLGRDQLIAFKMAHQRGDIYDRGPSNIVGVDHCGNYRAIAFIRTSPDTAIYAKTGMRSQHFDVCPSEILGEITLFDLWACYQEVIEGRRSALSISKVQQVIKRFSERTQMCRASTTGRGDEIERHWSRSSAKCTVGDGVPM